MKKISPVMLCVLLAIFALLCLLESRESTMPTRRTMATGKDDDFSQEHQEMVEVLRRYGIKDQRILDAMLRVKRHLFIPASFQENSDPYGDYPCSIGHGQTISQPYIVAYMTEKLDLKPGEKVLEIGTGSGYQAAVLAEIGASVYSIEILPPLAKHARDVISSQGYANVRLLTGNGYAGWPEHAPFDAIIVTCAPDDVPKALIEQLAEGGRMIIPVGSFSQRLVILMKANGKVQRIDDLAVRFVPMVGK